MSCQQAHMMTSNSQFSHLHMLKVKVFNCFIRVVEGIFAFRV